MSDFASHFDPTLARELAARLAAHVPGFDGPGFVDRATDGLDALAMKARVAHMADAIAASAPGFEATARGIVASLGPVRDPDAGGGWADFGIWPLTMYVQRHGLDHVAVSLDALGELTRRFTAEFAIRPFLVHHPDATMARLRAWVDADCAHQRRLVSEGTRPRLPWGARLRALQADPTPAIALIDRLIDDPSEYVRRSVANHLNDIAKDHPALAVDVARRWRDDDAPQRVRLLRHGLRTRVKAGDPDALALVGIRADAAIVASRFDATEAVALGDALHLAAELSHDEPEAVDVVVDFVVHHVRANGARTPKVFKWRRATIAAGQTLHLEKQHPIRPITTRRYYPGAHRVDLQVNGRVVASREFTLDVPDPAADQS